MSNPDTNSVGFLDRRRPEGIRPDGVVERRQFGQDRSAMAPEIQEFADAMDAYKFQNGRRNLTLEEVFGVFQSLGYHR